MKINFYPDYDDPKFEKAAKEYAEIWNQEGNRIVKVLEKLSRLKFKEKVINATVYEDKVSWSHPLKLDYKISKELKKGVLVHEMIHRLFKANSLSKLKIPFSRNSYVLSVHKVLDLILYDAWVELYGEKFAKDHIKYEIRLWTGKGINPYKIAWDWALSMTKEQRTKEFGKYF